MTECKIVAFMALDGPPYLAGGASRACYQCETHGMTDIGPAERCPVGKIEAAVEDGLRRIDERLNAPGTSRGTSGNGC